MQHWLHAKLAQRGGRPWHGPGLGITVAVAHLVGLALVAQHAQCHTRLLVAQLLRLLTCQVTPLDVTGVVSTQQCGVAQLDVEAAHGAVVCKKSTEVAIHSVQF